MPEQLSAPLRLSLDSNALAENWQVMNKLSGSARAGAAVKADGYGLGARRVARILQQAGCRDFFVAHWQEARDLLDVIDPASITVLHGPLLPGDVEYARATGVRPVINSPLQARRWLDGGGGACALMVDSGINRLGILSRDLGDESIQALDIELLLSHLASADEVDSPVNEKQLECWITARGIIHHHEASFANSAGIMLGKRYHANLTRPGLALYGGVPCQSLEGRIRQVARLQAALLQVRTAEAGETIGYNATFTVPRAMRIGTVALGYADGYLRCWSGKGSMHSNGRALPVLGRISMDMTVIDLSTAPELQEGDWVEVDYNLPDAARISGLSQYELLTLLGYRFMR